jgi:hypothetical protein
VTETETQQQRPLRILVTGWRFWPDEYAWVITDALRLARIGILPSVDVNNPDDIRPARPYWFERPLIIRHGQCPYGGVDLYADRWAREHGHAVERYPADFKGGGGAAGPKRNTLMVNHGPTPDLCLGFPGPGTRGTLDCMTKAWEAGIETVVNAFIYPFDMNRLDPNIIDWSALPTS